MDFIRRRPLSVFGHIARLTQGTPAHNALHCQVGLACGRSLGRDWRRRPGRPRVRWTDQLCNDTGNLWRQTGHSVGPWWSDATARAGYAMTTTSTNSNFIRCSFSFSAPTIWNKLPSAIMESSTLDTFKHRLKMHPTTLTTCSAVNTSWLPVPQIRLQSWLLCAIQIYFVLYCISHSRTNFYTDVTILTIIFQTWLHQLVTFGNRSLAHICRLNISSLWRDITTAHTAS